ncbi:alpha/beta fold hydrolase [Legionella worsleiensis]|uniref:Lipolytic enzyme n=1 Tax=Legionella worsleiensis TaxID=45076 RepID=A0A0W1AJZ7_9GAMM|nr:alpha/beta hydrolase [Legionella worsleiensis]KTD81655.1 lipolytic enzyme [Legionella worsleiensis]STY31935.1 lipolytic protein [Legionella worsleiensis]
MNKIERDGFSLNYKIEGQGIPIIVIGSHLYYPRTFSEALREKVQLICMDHRGFGSTSRSVTNEDFSLSKLIEDIEALRKHLGLETMALLGHSGHGYIALEYAKYYPQRVSHLILLAMSPCAGAENFTAANRYFEESVCPLRKQLLNDSYPTLEEAILANPRRAFIIRMLVFAPMIWYQPDYDATWLWEGVEVIPEMFEHVWMRVFPELDITKQSDKLQCPIFLGLGRYDYWNPPYLWEPMRFYFKQLTIRVFERSGHTPQLEEPVLFDETLLTWLKQKEI